MRNPEAFNLFLAILELKRMQLKKLPFRIRYVPDQNKT